MAWPRLQAPENSRPVLASISDDRIDDGADHVHDDDHHYAAIPALTIPVQNRSHPRRAD